MLSFKEQRRRNIARTVFRQAWQYHKRTVLFTVTLATSIKIAWKTVRSFIRLHHSKVVGVRRRQAVLWRLMQYRTEDIILDFRREPSNTYNPCAIQVIASVKGKGTATLGYLQQALAKIITPILDSDKKALVMLDRITGPGPKGILGCNISYLII